MTMQIGGSKAGGALRLSLPFKSSVVIPGSPSARLTLCLNPNTGHWLLRFSVLRETLMTSILSIPFQKAKMLRSFEFMLSEHHVLKKRDSRGAYVTAQPAFHA